jgi:hypothetical protein
VVFAFACGVMGYDGGMRDFRILFRSMVMAAVNMAA